MEMNIRKDYMKALYNIIIYEVNDNVRESVLNSQNKFIKAAYERKDQFNDEFYKRFHPLLFHSNYYLFRMIMKNLYEEFPYYNVFMDGKFHSDDLLYPVLFNIIQQEKYREKYGY